MNWSSRTRFFTGGKIFHKPDQIIVINKEGDIIFSGVARSVGGDTEGACKAIMHSKPVEPQVLSPRVPEPVATPAAASVPVPTEPAHVASVTPPASGVTAGTPVTPVKPAATTTAPTSAEAKKKCTGAYWVDKNGTPTCDQYIGPSSIK